MSAAFGGGLAALVFFTSFLSGIFGMPGGMILMGALLLFLSVPAAMVLHADRSERLAQGDVEPHANFRIALRLGASGQARRCRPSNRGFRGPAAAAENAGL